LYSKQAIRNFLEWGSTEITGVSPLAMSLMELHLELSFAVEQDDVNGVQDIAKAYVEGLRELQKQRRAKMYRVSNGFLLSKKPSTAAFIKWLDDPSNPLPKSHKEWAKKYVLKGENYG
jgi:hypothetical protein